MRHTVVREITLLHTSSGRDATEKPVDLTAGTLLSLFAEGGSGSSTGGGIKDASILVIEFCARSYLVTPSCFQS